MLHSHIKQVLWTTGFALLCSQAWAINKCTGIDGQTTFQDTPCAGKGEAINIRPASGQNINAAALPNWKQKAAEVDKRIAIRAAVERREAVIGMNGEELQQAMGLPNRINTGEYKTGSTQQRIYDWSGTTWYVYTDGQLVTAVQTAIGSASAPAVSCPSGLEIRNAETSASSILLSEAERKTRLYEIRQMKA